MSNFMGDIKTFSKCALRPTSTHVTTPGGRQLNETLEADGTTKITELNQNSSCYGFVADYVPDLQVAHVLPGLLMGKLIHCMTSGFYSVLPVGKHEHPCRQVVPFF